MLCEKCKDEGIIVDLGAKPPYGISHNVIYCDCIIARVEEEAHYKSMKLIFNPEDAEKEIIFN